MTKPKLRKNAEINPPQSPHDGIHTCSRGCSKPGCNRTLRDTIEEQDKQIEALKRDVLEAAARLRSVAEDNKRECEVTRIENARLKAEVERLKEDNRQLTNAFEIAEGIIKRMGKAAEAAAKEGKPSV